MLLRCPYCQHDLPPERPTSVACPACGKTMALPPGLAPKRDRRTRTRAFDKISREAERQRRDLRLPPGARLGRKPSFLLLALLGLAVLGGALVTATRQATLRRPVGYRVDKAATELDVLATALGIYRLHVGHYPTTAEGELAALVADPGLPGWSGPYITKLLPDPWGRPYRYSSTTTPPSLSSHGPDRKAGTPDDLSATPDRFEVDPAVAADWVRGAPRRPTVAIPAATSTNDSPHPLLPEEVP